ncbi:putative lysosomal cobalamin transporter [Podosphaera aphanis]|nr:putative lysosomal cobalamin transporter [Podosphaera aphanis]
MELIQTAFIWISYGVAVGLAFVVATIFTYSYQNSRDRSVLVSTVAIITLTSLLATVLLLPVDIALISSTTSELGLKKPWATPEKIDKILLSLKIVYYTLYCFDVILCFLVVPFTYFFYEEYDDVDAEEGQQTFLQRFFGALKYTVIFIILAVILFVVGFFIPVARNRTGSQFDFDYFKRLLIESRGERALTFGLGLLISLGTLLYILYTAAGVAMLPILMIKSAPSISAHKLLENTATALEQNRERQRQLENRITGIHETPSTKDQRELEALAREERTLVRRERLAAEVQGRGKRNINKIWIGVLTIIRPLKLLFGVLSLLLSLVVWVSMLITGIDKAKNSICKRHCGYILGNINVFQPVNYVFVRVSKLFPLDYVLIALLILYLFISSVAGITILGIRFLWIRLFEISRGHTAPQGMLIMTVNLTLIIFAINYSITMMVAPQYAIYGAQSFCNNPPRSPNHQPDCSGHPELILPCSELSSDDLSKGVCTPSVVSTFLNRITLNFPFFGILIFWAQFVFLAIFLVVFLTSLLQTPKLNLSKIDELAETEEEESLLANTERRFGAAWQDICNQTQTEASGQDRCINGPGCR